MILEVKQWPESQEVMGEEGWFFISSSSHDKEEHDLIGDAAYARILDKSEYILFEKTTADEFNKDFISAQDPGDEHQQKDYGPPYGPHNPTGNEKPPNCS